MAHVATSSKSEIDLNPGSLPQRCRLLPTSLDCLWYPHVVHAGSAFSPASLYRRETEAQGRDKSELLTKLDHNQDRGVPSQLPAHPTHCSYLNPSLCRLTE